MTRGTLNRVLGELQRTMEPDEPDARLMERFIAHGDEQAFAALLRRHGPMVYGVCRRVLGNADDAEDVFQATFLVLVRQARSLRRLGSVGGWLHGVAYRTALEARRAMARRRAKEAQVTPQAMATDQAMLTELREVLDVELARLPERYREVVVLCDLEGQGRKEAARRLRCPEGTVASRLAKARSLLAARLTRQGVTLSAAAMGSALAAEAASGGVPPTWLSGTITAARHIAGHTIGTAGVVSARVTSLVQGVSRTMVIRKLTAVVAILFVVVVLGSSAGTIYFQAAAAGPPDDAPVANAAAQEKPEDTRAELVQLKEELELLRKKADTLQARLAAMERGRPDVLFRGKPATYWIKALEDRDPKFRMEALEALGGIAEVDRTLVPTIVATLLRDTDDSVRDTASVQLAAKVGDAALPLLIAAFKESKQERRNWAMYTLARYSEDVAPAVPALAALLKSSKRADRIVAAEVLGRFGPDAAPAVPALLELLKDRSAQECNTAVIALGRIGPGARAAVPQLSALLEDTSIRKFTNDRTVAPVLPPGPTDTILAASAATALGDMGQAARAALPALRVLADCPGMADTARNAIRRISVAPAKD